MSSKRCAQCGLINWPEDASCKRCGATLADTLQAGASGASGEKQSVQRRKTSGKAQVVRALLWALGVHVALGAVVVGLAEVYDWATGAPPRQTGPPHSPPSNPFILLAILVISPCFAPFVYLLIAALLLVLFTRREDARQSRTGS